MNNLLQQAPPEKQEDAEAVAQSAEALVKIATASKPNKTMLQITSEGLKQAAQALVEVSPEIQGIVGRILATVVKMVA